MRFPLILLGAGILCVLSAAAQTPQTDLKRAGLNGPVYAVSSITKAYVKAQGKWVDSSHLTRYYDKNGSLTLELSYIISANALSGPEELRDAALDAVKQWTFARTKLSGEPVKVIGTITFNFQK